VRLERADTKIIEQWVAIVGYGYDTESDPNDGDYDATSLKGRGIAMINVETGELVAERRFGSGTNEVADMLYAMPATPSVLDLDQDGYADVVYIGDLGGNIWKWVIRDAGTYAPLSTELHQANWSFRKFFSEDPSRSPGDHRRSFFHAPAATIISGTLYLAVGSGERANLNCSSTLDGCTVRNRYYVLKDHDRYDTGTLVEIDGRETTTGDLTDVTSFEDQCPATEREGYFFELADGEKFTANTAVFNSFFFAATYTPDLTDACVPSGTSILYGTLAKCGQGFFGPPSSYNPAAGQNRSYSIGSGLSSDPKVSISPGGNRIIINKQDGELISTDAGSSASEHGTLYWRELN
jgi:type IV pilus assembly protein PilY1